jgi:hypothetical protein
MKSQIKSILSVLSSNPKTIKELNYQTKQLLYSFISLLLLIKTK